MQENSEIDEFAVRCYWKTQGWTVSYGEYVGLWSAYKYRPIGLVNSSMITAPTYQELIKLIASKV